MAAPTMTKEAPTMTKETPTMTKEERELDLERERAQQYDHATRHELAIHPAADGPYIAWALTATSVLCLVAATLSAPFTKLSLLSTPVPIGLWGHCNAYARSSSCELTWPWPSVRGGEVLAYTSAFGRVTSWTNLAVPICALVQLAALAALHRDSSRGRWAAYPTTSVVASAVAMFTFVAVYTSYIRAAALLSLDTNIPGAVNPGPGLTAILTGCVFALVAHPLSSLETRGLDWVIDHLAGPDWHPEERAVQLETEQV
ncbi:hypothetical protein Q8F55_001078 [Vanrija albida]|uniref:Uncharacterized protein n=1 Tax=Vanrija albida TaxID=181172 RepID=A0ABR3QF40_9TREE